MSTALKERSHRLVLLTTSRLTLQVFFDAQIRFLRSEGFDVRTISSPAHPRHADDSGLPTDPVKMQRKISPFADLPALVRICVLLRRFRPALVHTHTPKAGLLGMIAARAAGVRIRIYTVNGLVWIANSDFRRRVLMLTERLACTLATDVLAVSKSMERIVVETKICPPGKGSGSWMGR